MKLYSAAGVPWTKGRGYQKRILLAQEHLGIEGSFLQEVAFEPGSKVPLHYHSQTTEVFFALDRAFFQIGEEKVVMEPEDVLVCEPGDIHGNPEVPQPFRILVLKVNFHEDDTVWLE
jgi:quercetin dioxygenase-like cupin family protein